MTTQFNNGQILDAAATEAVLKGKPFIPTTQNGANLNADLAPTDPPTVSSRVDSPAPVVASPSPQTPSRKVNFNLDGPTLAAAIRASHEAGYPTLSTFVEALVRKELENTVGKPRIGSTSAGKVKVTKASHLSGAVSLPLTDY
jgi:hypothetical protein